MTLQREQIQGLSFNQEKLNTKVEFTPSEKDALREHFTDTCIAQSTLEDEFAEVRKQYKADIKVLAKEAKKTMIAVKTGHKDVDATVYCVANTETKMIDLYDMKTFQLISSRRPMPEEREHVDQLTILSTGNNAAQKAG